MFYTTGHGPKVALLGIVLAAAFSCALSATAPIGWYVAGSKPQEYEAGVDANATYQDHVSAYLKSKVTAVEGFGTLMQDFRADKYVGKRIRFRANVKTEDVKSWAGLWMRVDKQITSLAFDNMHERPISGKTGWHEYAVVLNVARGATGISFGVLLTGPGTAGSTVPKSSRLEMAFQPQVQTPQPAVMNQKTWASHRSRGNHIALSNTDFAPTAWFVVPAQAVDATLAWSLPAGVWNPKVFLWRWETSQFLAGNIAAAANSYFRSCRAARDFADRRSRPAHRRRGMRLSA
jgi:hypothetical protein